MNERLKAAFKWCEDNQEKLKTAPKKVKKHKKLKIETLIK